MQLPNRQVEGNEKMIRSSVRTAAGTLAAAALFSAVATAQTATLQPRWSHVSGAENWVARSVSLGNEGTEVFSQLDYNGLSRRLFTEGAGNPAQPLWASPDAQLAPYQRVASCESQSLHAAVRDKLTAGGHRLVLSLFSSGSDDPLWTYETPAQSGVVSSFEVMFTQSGDRIVLASYRNSTGRAEVRSFSPSSNDPITTYEFETFGLPNAYRLSEDGARFYVGSALAASVFDLSNGQLAYRRFITGQVGSQDVSGTGDSIALGFTGTLCLYSSVPTGTWGYSFCHPVTPGALCRALEICPDGSRLAVSYTSTANPGTATIELIDLAASLTQGTANVLWTYVVPSTGTFFNAVTKFAFSNDSRTLAVGLMGDEGGSSPEILVFKDDLAVPAFRGELPGSVQSLGLAPDGRRLVVASKSVHDTTFGGDGSIDYYELGSRDLWVDGVPHANGVATLKARTTPGRPVRLLASMGRVNDPTTVGNIPGMLHIDRMRMISTTSMSQGDSNGLSTKSWSLAGIPVGTSVYFQTLALNPRQLGRDWAKITVVP